MGEQTTNAFLRHSFQNFFNAKSLHSNGSGSPYKTDENKTSYGVWNGDGQPRALFTWDPLTDTHGGTQGSS